MFRGLAAHAVADPSAGGGAYAGSQRIAATHFVACHAAEGAAYQALRRPLVVAVETRRRWGGCGHVLHNALGVIDSFDFHVMIMMMVSVVMAVMTMTVCYRSGRNQ